MRTGAQLYTVRAYTQNEKDFAFTIKKIADMGYKTVQISAIGRDIKPERVREHVKRGWKSSFTHWERPQPYSLRYEPSYRRA